MPTSIHRLDRGPPMLWNPPPDERERTEVGHYLDWLERHRGRTFGSYRDLWRWSVEDQDGSWGSLWDFFAVKAHAPYERVMGSDAMPAAGSRLTRQYCRSARGSQPAVWAFSPA